MSLRLELRHVGFLLVFSILVGCAPAAGDRNGPPLADSTFVSALVALHVADASAFAEDRTPAVHVRDSVLTALDVPASDYEATLAWHVEHPEALTAIYNQVLDRLNRLDLPDASP
ncbi:MAG: DUF4296 domain-containing protein [Rhodothermales bacterium]